jgi:tRNA threonylcarbamoyladenosine biosynthesis protein TsaE
MNTHNNVMSDPSFELADELETLSFGARLASQLQSGTKLYLSGDLGTGKTTLARGILRGLGYGGSVKSPTFTLVELYKLSTLDLHHFDFYRINDPEECSDAGFREIFDSDSVCLVEWPEKAAGFLPEPDIAIRMQHAPKGRIIHLVPGSAVGSTMLRRVVGV